MIAESNTVHRGGLVSGGILLGRSKVNSRFMLMLSPSSDGESSILEIQIGDITFVLPDFVPSSLAHKCSQIVPDQEMIMSLLQSLRHLEIRVEEQTRLLVARGAHDLYRRTMNRNPTRDCWIDTTQALESLKVSVASKEAHLAVHRMLMDDPLHFIADQVSLRTSGVFKLRWRGELQRFETVRGWVRGQSPYLTRFAEKAARIRQQGLEIKPKNAKSPIEPLQRQIIADSWTAEDLQILWFLHDALDNERSIQIQPYLAIAPSIIKGVDEVSRRHGMQVPDHGHDVSRQRIMSFFAEIGVTPPWENWIVHEGQSHLQMWDRMSARLHLRARGMDESATSNSQKTANGKRTKSLPINVKPGYYSHDAHEAVRHDFGQTPVYTIDDAGAMELDDGISIVPAPATSKDQPSWWIHVHIADPTALLQASHPLSLLAQHRDHTEYFPERTWSMLPDWFVINEKLSLGSREGQEQPTLTMSMRVDEDGQVLESDVKVGVVRNVRRLTYSAVNEVLGSAKEESLASVVLSLGESRDISTTQARRTDDAALLSDESARSDLNTLHYLAKKMIVRRVADNSLYWQFPTASVSVSPTLPHHTTFSKIPAFYTTAPSVKLRLPSPGVSHISPAQLLVSEMMVAANRAAARFSVERGIPVPFRSQAAPVVDPAVLEKVLKLRNPATGEASGADIVRLGVDFLPGVTNVEPAPHWPMGIQDEYGYVKVTSPLRRYADLFAHWQLKSALLPKSAAPTAFTPSFTRSAVLSQIQGFENAHKARGRLSQHAEHFWALYLLKNKLAAAATAGSTLDEPILDSLVSGTQPALALRQASFSAIASLWTQPVVLPELGLRATLVSKKESEASALGETVNVKVQDIRLGTRSRMLVERA